MHFILKNRTKLLQQWGSKFFIFSWFQFNLYYVICPGVLLPIIHKSFSLNQFWKITCRLSQIGRNQHPWHMFRAVFIESRKLIIIGLIIRNWLMTNGWICLLNIKHKSILQNSFQIQWILLRIIMGKNLISSKIKQTHL